MNKFAPDLEWSLQAGDEPFWEAVYQKAFPNLKTMELVTRPDWQRKGIDRLLTLTNGNKLKIDEKKRRKVYPDILLEYLSNDHTRAPGWMEKDLAIDYLAYAFMPTRRVYLFPWPILRRAWQEYGQGWLAAYDHKEAVNPGYSTWSIAVPIEVVRQATHQATIIQV